MYIEGGYAWFIADVGRDQAGRPAIRVHHWNRKAGTLGQLFEVINFADGSTPSATCLSRGCLLPLVVCNRLPGP